MSARAVVGSQCDVGAEYGARAAEEVLEVLPADAVWQLRGERRVSEVLRG